MSSSYNPVRIPLKNKWLASLFERLLGLKKLITYYDTRPVKEGQDLSGQPFLKHILGPSCLDISLKIKNKNLLEQIPKQGPAIFIANHPLGGLEGMAMTDLLLDYRPDTLVLTNEMLTKIPELSKLFIGVDVLSTNAARENAKSMRKIYKHLSNGGALLAYPAGVVSAINTKTWKVEDREWNDFVARLVKKYQATCIPFFVGGRNSQLFYLLGLIHKRLRTIMLPRELANKKGSSLDLNVGHPILPEEFKSLDDTKSITQYLRIATDLLAMPSQLKPNQLKKEALKSQSFEPIEQTSNRNQLLIDLEKLQDCLLVSKNGFSIYCAPYNRLGSVMNEIAYAREVTFRAAGEGTGLSKDSDRFDPYYLHLFLWDDEKQKLVGGYRIGKTNEIIKTRGTNALYSRSLYRFKKKYINRLGNTLEMGRSFITLDYQKHPRALDMLWRGIGSYVAKNPEYHTLFGCVSISAEHSELAKAFISDSMMQSFRAEQKFLNDIRPVVPLKVKGKLWSTKALASLSNIAVINKLLGRCEAGKSIPILLRQYLSLNGKFVCFSVNEGFSNSLDGLILVDLRETPKKYLQRYLGQEGSQLFLKKWSKDEIVI